MLHPGFVRYYEDVILALAEGGSSVHLAFETARAKLGEDQTVRACQTITDFCVLGAAGWIV